MSKSVAMSIFSNNLKRLLRDKGLTVSELAADCDIRRSYLSRLLHGHHSPSLDVAEKIANACGVPLYEMLTPRAEKISA